MSYFGIPPSGYESPLNALENLNDVQDKEAARQNLGAASMDDVARSANPIGTIIAFYGANAPYGYLPCYGQSISSVVFPDLVEFLNPGQTSATVPDLRGEFLRGWDDGRGVDVGRALKSWQADELKSHTHSIQYTGLTYAIYGASRGTRGISQAHVYSPKPTGATGATGGVETRPRNIAVLYCIKAYDAPVGRSVIDLAQIAADMVPMYSFTGANQALGTSGFQKLPGGLILQWGQISIVHSAANTAGAQVTLPLTFPAACSSVSLTCSTASLLAAASSVTSSGFYVTSADRETSANPTGTNVVRWIAVGY